MSTHLSYEQLEQKLPYILAAPKNEGEVKLIVTRPVSDERVIHESIELSAAKGVTGDKWANECWLTLDDGSPHPDVQVCIMNWRCIASIEEDSERWALAGDNLFIDMDLGVANLHPGDQLCLGDSILEITAQAHNACMKFVDRFGRGASKFVNDKRGRENRLRGIYAKVIQDGTVSLGDKFTKL